MNLCSIQQSLPIVVTMQEPTELLGDMKLCRHNTFSHIKGALKKTLSDYQLFWYIYYIPILSLGQLIARPGFIQERLTGKDFPGCLLSAHPSGRIKHLRSATLLLNSGEQGENCTVQHRQLLGRFGCQQQNQSLNGKEGCARDSLFSGPMGH